MQCPKCQADSPDDQRFCGACGAPLDAGGDVTRLSDDVTRMSPPALRSPSAPTRTSAGGPSATSGQGWLSSSGSIDHGRFSPGTLLENRYRIIGLLGRGGMGEVYRADDLRLGQQVALKFLPAALARDPQRLAQFHNEVRTARQVSHQNVCRVYDIGEIDASALEGGPTSGQADLFLTMEYIDGEDLAASLRRIGRFAEDKAIDIARQICAGLSAAHERGVLHRDLKPANIMLDGTGHVRLMDFGLASVGEVSDIRAGTPAYMSPEQLEGREVTVRSDIYALGLVLYELFTGRRAFDAKTIADLVEQHHSGTLTAPTTLVKTLDPSIERAILRCLDPDPARRPSSALAVSAALPGGDPLAAALAAGETPSPEMVAAAGGEQPSLSSREAVAWLVAIAVLIVVVANIASRYSMFARVPLSKPAAALAENAEQIRENFGYTDAVVDQVSGFTYAGFYLHWADRHGAGNSAWPDLPSGRPAAVKFWYRTSPRPLSPLNRTGDPSQEDPPFAISGMTAIELDTKGRLLQFEAMPSQVDPDKPSTAPPVDWTPAFAAAGLDRSTFTEVTPTRTPRTIADERHAWQSTAVDTAAPVHIEAAGYRGKPVWFEVQWPWSFPSREASVLNDDAGNKLNIILVLALLGISAALTRMNLKSGRADRRGAFRLATFTFFMMAATWIVAPHVRDLTGEEQRLFTSLGIGLFLAGALYVVYLALEPFVRKSWPTMLIGWSRLLSGRVRDPILGRELLLGVAGGCALSLLDGAHLWLPRALGWQEPVPAQPSLTPLLGLRPMIETVIGCLNFGLQNGLIITLEFALFREGVRRVMARFHIKLAGADRVAWLVALVIMTIATVNDANPTVAHSWVPALYEALSLGIILWTILNVGLIGACVIYIVDALLDRAPITLDPSKFYASAGWTMIAIVIAIALVGQWLARGSAGGAASVGRRGAVAS